MYLNSSYFKLHGGVFLCLCRLGMFLTLVTTAFFELELQLFLFAWICLFCGMFRMLGSDMCVLWDVLTL